jgi:heptosyltransferase-2
VDIRTAGVYRREEARIAKMGSRALKDMMLRLYFPARMPFIFLLKLLFAVPSGKQGGVSKILIVRLDRLGDLVLSLPLIENLRIAYPSAKIDLLVRPYLADLAGMVKAVNDVIVYRGKIDAFRRLPNREYDIVIDMLRDYRLEPALVTFFSKAPVRIGFRGGFREIFFTHPVDGLQGSSKSMVELDLELLKPLGVQARVTVPKLDPGEMAVKEGPVIAVHPGGHYDSQKWAAGNFASLIKKILEGYKAKVVVVGGPDDKEAVAHIIKIVNDGNAHAVFPSLKDLVHVLAGCDLLVCNNSGPLHLAAALGVPTVSMMGPTDTHLWWPKGDNQVVIRKGVKCSPCSLGKCKEHLCMDLITADDVFGEVRKFLEKIYGYKG